MTVNPASQRVVVTQTAKLTTTVSGVGREDINGETNDILIIDRVTKDDGGTYECLVWNEYGDCVTSNISELST